MPATRNDITHKPIMTDTSREVTKWAAVDSKGEFRVIWSRTEKGAREYATDLEWKFIGKHSGKIQGNEL